MVEMVTQTTIISPHILQSVAIATLFLTICFFFPRLVYHAKLARLPVFGNVESGEKQRQYYLKSAKKIYLDGYAKFKDSVYRVATADGEDTIVIPPQFLPELRNLRDSVLSFPKAVEKVMEARYTKIVIESPMIVHSIKADLTPALSRLSALVYEEVEQSVLESMPEGDDWTPVHLYMALCTMVAKISGRIFVGPTLCRSKEYLECAIQYTMDVMKVQRSVKLIRPWLRPILVPRLPEYKQLRKREQLTEDLLKPVVEARLEAKRNDPNYEKPDDMLQWFMDRSNDYGGHSSKELASLQRGLIFAAVHTTTMTATNVFYTLAAYPEYIQPIRDEIRAVKAEHGDKLNTRALQQMIKLDSFMKEATRVYPSGTTSFQRKVLRGFTLSNGQYIPAGVNIEVPSHAIYNDRSKFSDTADEFDGFRFARLRSEGGTAHARNQFVTTNEQNLMFGYGAHACPGRFFAANEIKLVVASIVLKYDFKNEGDSKERYPDFEIGAQRNIDGSRKLLFRKVRE